MRADGAFAQPASTLVLMFLGLIMAPITTYLYAAHASWTWMYLVNPEAVPSFAILPLVALHSATVLLGWYVGARLILAGRLMIAAYVSAAAAVVSLLGVLIFWNRLGRYGTYVEFEQHRALPIMEVKLGYVLVALTVGVVASAAFVAFELLLDSRRVKSH